MDGISLLLVALSVVILGLLIWRLTLQNERLSAELRLMKIASADPVSGRIQSANHKVVKTEYQKGLEKTPVPNTATSRVRGPRQRMVPISSFLRNLRDGNTPTPPVQN